jgi:hypothetical protein
LWGEKQALMNLICIREMMPEEWHNAAMCPVPKEYYKFEYSNYGEMPLLNVLVSYKILINNLHKRLCP